MNSFTQINLTTTLQQQFSEFDTPVRIAKAVENIKLFIQHQEKFYFPRSRLETIVKTLGFKRVLARITDEKREIFFSCVEQFLLYEFFRSNSLNFDSSLLNLEDLKFDTAKEIVTTTSHNQVDPTTLGYALQVGKAVPALGNTIAGTNTTHKTMEINYMLKPTFDVAYQIGNKIVDQFIRDAHFLVRYSNSKVSKFQEFQLRFLAVNLCARIQVIRKEMQFMRNSKVFKNNKNILTDYLENLFSKCLDVLATFKNKKLIPYMVELNGTPGVGKTTFVELLSQMLREVLPFYSEDFMVYSRVNDKFWNGYRQQPIVLYDDQNQTDHMLYNLDNEIVSIGGGQFVYPPMAFEKETLFGSIFVVFTTNTPIIETTKVNKGAISRRVEFVSVEPKSNLGEYIDEGNIYWKYYSDVVENPFNILFNGNSPCSILQAFLNKMFKQIQEVKETNPFELAFIEYSRKFEECETEKAFHEQLDLFYRDIKCEQMFHGKLVLVEEFKVPPVRAECGIRNNVSFSSEVVREILEAKTVSTSGSNILSRKTINACTSEVESSLLSLSNRRKNKEFKIGDDNVKFLQCENIIFVEKEALSAVVQITVKGYNVVAVNKVSFMEKIVDLDSFLKQKEFIDYTIQNRKWDCCYKFNGLTFPYLFMEDDSRFKMFQKNILSTLHSL